MSEKKELKQEELEKVNGGNVYDKPENVKWAFDVGAQVFIKEDNNLIEAKVTKLGYSYDRIFKFYSECYYLVGNTNSKYDGWFDGGSTWKGNVTYVWGRSKSAVTTVKQ